MILAMIQVSGVCARATFRRHIPHGIIGAQVQFDFDANWDGLQKTAVFRGCVTKDVIMEDNVVTIPPETIAQPVSELQIGVYGTSADGTVAIPTLWANIGRVLYATDPSGDTTTDGTLPVWAQMHNRIVEMEENIPKLVEAATPQRGKDYWTNEDQNAIVSDTKEEIGIPAPSPEVAGKALIANGDGTGFEFGEAVGGGGVQPDWNVNDPEADGYIKNRPFYSYTETTVKEATISSDAYTSEVDATLGIYMAQIAIDTSAWIPSTWLFSVVFDGVTYNRLAPFDTVLASTLIGNGSLLAPLFEAYGYTAPEDTGEPFVIQFINDDPITTAFLVTDLTQSTTHEVSVIQISETEEETVVKVPKKYYDGGVGKIDTSSNGTGEVFNDYSRNVASGNYSHAEGNATRATGSHSHAEGNATSSSGSCSHAEGAGTGANGDYSHAEGFSTQAGSLYQHVQGKYNIVESKEKYAHIVGNGSANDNRSNAHTLDWNGLGWFAGGLKVGGTGQDDPEAKNIATEEYVDSKAVNVTGATPGQMILVKAVDEEGKPTEWEVADPVKSWDDLGIAGYTNGTVLKGSTPVFSEDFGGFIIADSFSIEAGKIYEVRYKSDATDIATYVCTAEAIYDEDGVLQGMALGNTSVVGGSQITEDPFLIASVEGQGLLLPLDGGTSIWLTIYGDVPIYAPVPVEYLPTTPFVINFTAVVSSTTLTITSDTDFSEILKAIQEKERPISAHLIIKDSAEREVFELSCFSEETITFTRTSIGVDSIVSKEISFGSSGAIFYLTGKSSASIQKN